MNKTLTFIISIAFWLSCFLAFWSVNKDFIIKRIEKGDILSSTWINCAPVLPWVKVDYTPKRKLFFENDWKITITSEAEKYLSTNKNTTLIFWDLNTSDANFLNDFTKEIFYNNYICSNSNIETINASFEGDIPEWMKSSSDKNSKINQMKYLCENIKKTYEEQKNFCLNIKTLRSEYVMKYKKSCALHDKEEIIIKEILLKKALNTSDVQVYLESDKVIFPGVNSNFQFNQWISWTNNTSLTVNMEKTSSLPMKFNCIDIVEWEYVIWDCYDSISTNSIYNPNWWKVFNVTLFGKKMLFKKDNTSSDYYWLWKPNIADPIVTDQWKLMYRYTDWAEHLVFEHKLVPWDYKKLYFYDFVPNSGRFFYLWEDKDNKLIFNICSYTN